MGNHSRSLLDEMQKQNSKTSKNKDYNKTDYKKDCKNDMDDMDDMKHMKNKKKK